MPHKMKSRKAPELQAGSVADIAFLLLIFFLVTTTLEPDQGLLKQLPPENQEEEVFLRERNVLRLYLNQADSLWVEDRVLPVDSLFRVAADFIDNGAAAPGTPMYCSYCKGQKSGDSSDSPHIAAIQITHDRNTSYGFYIAVQNELSRAYTFLRDREGLRLYGKSYAEMEETVFNPYTPREVANQFNERLAVLRELYPIRIVEPSK